MAEVVVGALMEVMASVVVEAAKAAGLLLARHEKSQVIGVGEEIQVIKDDLAGIHSFLRHADRRKHHDPAVNEWVEEIRSVAHDVEDIVEDFAYSLAGRDRCGLRASVHDALHLPADRVTWHHIVDRLRQIKPRVDEVHNTRRQDILNRLASVREGTGTASGSVAAGPGSTPHPAGYPLFNEEQNIVGIEEHREKLVAWLMPARVEDGPRGPVVISVTGMGGQGKTTLVRAVYGDRRVKEHFDCRVWVSVSQSYQSDRAEELLRAMARELSEGPGQDDDVATMGKERLLHELRRLLDDKRYVIVLDDVWNRHVWGDISGIFRNCRRESRILLTTRDVHVAKSVAPESRILSLGFLQERDARSLFCRMAFRNRSIHDYSPDLQEWAQKIVDKCEGLPLAIVSIGSLMSLQEKTPLVWKNFCEDLSSEVSGNQGLDRMKRILMLSYYELPHHLKRCFLYCSIFPEDYKIKRKRLIRLWVADGCVQERGSKTHEEVAEEYIDELVSRNMLQVADTNESGRRVKACRLHDVMRELAVPILRRENLHLLYGPDNGSATLDDGARGLSINRQIEAAHSSADMRRLRSLFVFVPDMTSMPSFRLKLLRVLDLSGVPIDALPRQVFDLFNLRYLGLRNTKVRVLPPSLERLQSLQTLDLWGSEVTVLPREVVRLRNLRHLMMHDIDAKKLEYLNLHRSKGSPSGLWDLKCLQTLKTVQANEKLVAGMEKLKQLRTLSVSQVTALHGMQLYKSIGTMDRLLRLSLRAARRQRLQPESLRPPPHLQKLLLNGELQRVPSWFHSLQSLTHLYFFDSCLQVDPTLSLSALPNLVFLVLDNAYQGSHLRFDEGEFRSLKTLYLEKLPLQSLEFRRGSMQNLSKLYLCCCQQLRRAPQGMDHLTQLDQLSLREPCTQELVLGLRSLKLSGTLRAKVRLI